MTFVTLVTNDVTFVTNIATIFANESTISNFWVNTFWWFDTIFCILIAFGCFTATTTN